MQVEVLLQMPQLVRQLTHWLAPFTKLPMPHTPMHTPLLRVIPVLHPVHLFEPAPEQVLQEVSHWRQVLPEG